MYDQCHKEFWFRRQTDFSPKIGDERALRHHVGDAPKYCHVIVLLTNQLEDKDFPYLMTITRTDRIESSLAIIFLKLAREFFKVRLQCTSIASFFMRNCEINIVYLNYGGQIYVKMKILN